MTPTQHQRLDIALSFAEEALADGDVVTAQGALAKLRDTLDDIEPTEEKPAEAAEPDDDEEDNGEWHEGMTKEEDAEWSARELSRAWERRRAFEAREREERFAWAAARGGRTL